MANEVSEEEQQQAPAETPATTEEKVVKDYPDYIPPGSIQQLEIYIKGNAPLIQVVTHEEERLLREIYHTIAVPQKRGLWHWSIYRGLIKYTGEDDLIVPERARGEENETWDPRKALARIQTIMPDKKTLGETGVIFVMKDLHMNLAQPITRQLRDLYKHLELSKKTVIILGGSLAHGANGKERGLEPTLEKQVMVMDYSLPTRDEIEAYLREIAGPLKKKKKNQPKYTNEDFFRFSRALQGLTLTEIDNAMGVSTIHKKRLDETKLREQKKQIVARSGILEYIEANSQFDSIGGMDAAKQFFMDHTNSHSREAEEFGVEPLKGVLLIGIPGGGKSTLAKAVGNLFGEPTLRLDIGKVMSGLVGSSEAQMREVIKTAESIAPAILWIDEIEKSLSGTKSSNNSDGGTLARVFGTLLTAMEEGLKGITVLATANDISQLPPELIRRFSEVFFVDLPLEEERKEILSIHLKARKRDPKKFDLDQIVKASHRYTGAEIEKAVKLAIAKCFNDNRRDVTTEDLVMALSETKPISVVMEEPITKMREWAKNRARYASTLAAAAAGVRTVTSASGKKMSLDDALNDMPQLGGVKKKEKQQAPVAASRVELTSDEDDNQGTEER